MHIDVFKVGSWQLGLYFGTVSRSPAIHENLKISELSRLGVRMFHSLTTLVITAVLFVLLPAMVWWITAGRLRSTVGWWCWGSLMAATGLALMGLRPWLPPWTSYNLGNSCVLMSLVCWAQSLRSLSERAWPGWRMLLWTVLAVTYYSLLLVWVSPNLRGLAMRITLGALALYTASLTVPLVRRWHSHNAVVIGACYALLGMSLWAQVLLHSGGGQDPSPFSNSWDARSIAVLTLLTAAVGHLCFAGLIIEHAMQGELAIERARIASDETLRLQIHLRQDDRQHRLLLVSGSLAHELNQPLTVALARTQVAQRLLKTAPEQTDTLDAALVKVQAAIAWAHSILDRIRSNAKAQPLTLQPLDLRVVLATAVQWFDHEWQRLDVQFRCEKPKDAVWCHADEVALAQVLINLLRNATQAVEGGRHREIELVWVLSWNTACIEVLDSGPGLPAEMLTRWGEPFVSTRPPGVGLGMGLAIARMIVTQHGGELSLSNRPEGGACARVCLPRIFHMPAHPGPRET